MKTLSTSRGSSLLRLIALPVLLLLLTLPARPGFAQTAPQAVNVAVDPSNHTWMFWNNLDGSSSLWNTDSSGSVTASYDYGPYSDSGGMWKAVAFAVGPNGVGRILWTNPDGRATLWYVNPDGTFGLTGAYGATVDKGGVWRATALSIGPDNVAHILWNNPDGRATLWHVYADGSTDTAQAYGPFIDGGGTWQAVAVSVGPDNIAHLLWHCPDGRATYWSVGADNSFSTSAAYGPYRDAGGIWQATALATGPNGISRLLWHSPDGRTTLWYVNLDGAFGTSQAYASAGFSSVATAVGPDNSAYLLWSNANGTAQVWTVNADGTYAATPYSALSTELTAIPGDGTAALDWTGPTVGGDSYNLYRGTSPGGEGTVPVKKGLNSTPYSDTGLTDGVTYYYQVTAVTGTREGSPSAEVAVTPKTPAPPPPSRLTQAQAIALAQTFCQAVGAPVTATATATWPAPNPYPDQLPYYWQNRWLIQFDSQAEVEVVDATGAICRFYNSALSQQLMDANNLAGTPIPVSSANQAAALVLQASGLSGELAAAPTDQNFQITDPPTQAGDLWNVTWGRQFQGIPYRRQQATVMLQAETGALQAFSLTFTCPPPGAGPGAVTSSQAVQTAQTTLANAGYPNSTQQSVTLQVVQPNSQWYVGAYPYLVRVGPTPGSIAWSCVFTDSNNRIYEVWVDAYYANFVDGGEVYGIAGRRHTHAARHAAKPHAKTQAHAKKPAPKHKTPKIN